MTKAGEFGGKAGWTEIISWSEGWLDFAFLGHVAVGPWEGSEPFSCTFQGTKRQSAEIR